MEITYVEGNKLAEEMQKIMQGNPLKAEMIQILSIQPYRLKLDKNDPDCVEFVVEQYVIVHQSVPLSAMMPQGGMKH